MLTGCCPAPAAVVGNGWSREPHYLPKFEKFWILGHFWLGFGDCDLWDDGKDEDGSCVCLALQKTVEQRQEANSPPKF